MKYRLLAIAALAAASLSSAAAAQQVERAGRPIIEVAGQLKNGEFVWAPELSPSGPILMIVNLETQRAVLFRNGVPIAATSVSTGKPGYETPTGVFTILEKHKVHFSKTYDNAPMPNMQRLTWKGIALHAGKLPGYPASHGCIRLPQQFSSLLFGVTHLGMTVVITSVPAGPTNSPAPELATALHAGREGSLSRAPYEWHPERSRKGIISVIVSAADHRAIVLRGGIRIGSAPVRVIMPVDRATVYVLHAWDKTGQHWLKLQLSGAPQSMVVSAEEKNSFETPWEFRRAVAAAMKLGSVVIVTPESLSEGSAGRQQTVIDDEPAAP